MIQVTDATLKLRGSSRSGVPIERQSWTPCAWSRTRVGPIRSRRTENSSAGRGRALRRIAKIAGTARSAPNAASLWGGVMNVLWVIQLAAMSRYRNRALRQIAGWACNAPVSR